MVVVMGVLVVVLVGFAATTVSARMRPWSGFALLLRRLAFGGAVGVSSGCTNEVNRFANSLLPVSPMA